MSKPQLKELSMFITEGNPVAMLVTAVGAKLTKKAMNFKTPEAAFVWCRKNRSRFIYTPSLAAHN